MEFQTDHTVRLATDTEYENLYKWCLQEFDVNGNQVGRDLIPWQWSLDFRVSNLQYFFNLGSEGGSYSSFIDNDEAAEDEDTPEELPKVKTSEVIFADLTPSLSGWCQTTYSMLGTNREIKVIQLRVDKYKEDKCYLWGSVSFTTEIDFRDETTDDIIQIYLHLTPDKFDRLTSLVNTRIVNVASLRLSGVSGFYSEWSPGISTSYVKVLTGSHKDHKLEIPESCEINPPHLGNVSEFELQLGNSQSIAAEETDEAGSADAAWVAVKADEAISSVSEDYFEEERKDSGEEDDDLPRNDDHWTEETATAAASGSTTVTERVKLLKQSRKHELHRQMLRDASIYATKNKMPPHRLDDLSHDIGSFLSDLEIAFQKGNWLDYEGNAEALTKHYQRAWQLWRHQQFDFKAIKKGEVPYIDRYSLAHAVESYLKLPIKNRNIDRMLVDALVAAELFAFAEQMLHAPALLKDLSTSPLVRSHPLWRFVKSRAISFIFLVVIPIGLLVGSVKLFDIQEAWPLFVGSGFAGLWCLGFLVGLLALPSIWISESRKKKKVSDLLDAMNIVYTEIGGGNIVSAKYIRERLIKTTDKGAIWPSELYPLLDDIIERSGTM